MAAFEALTAYINSLENPKEFTEEEKMHPHPFKTVIHRKAEWRGSEELTKKELSKARTFCEEVCVSENECLEGYFEVEIKEGGLSCNDNCFNTGYIKSGNIPLKELGLPYKLENGCVTLGVKLFNVIRCYCRQLNISDSFTVKDALDCKGFSPLCKIDDGGFHCYWDKPNHVTLFCKEKLSQPTDAFDLLDCNKYVVFNQSVFDFNAWTYCGPDSDMIRISRAVIKIMQNPNTTIQKEISKMKDKTLKQIFNVLLEAFQHAEIGTDTHKIDESLCLLYDRGDLNPTEWREMCDLIYVYADDIFGHDTTYWYDSLRPQVEARIPYETKLYQDLNELTLRQTNQVT